MREKIYEKIFENLEDLLAVSYTHLDVYKRQVQDRAVRHDRGNRRGRL